MEEEGCGRCKHYLHLRGPSGSGGICRNPDSPNRGYIGMYGCLVEHCDMMEIE